MLKFTKKEYLIVFAFIILFINPFLYLGKTAMIIQSNPIIDFIYSDIGFWISIIITIIMSIIVLYFLFRMKMFDNISTNEIKRVSDDLLIVLYSIGWIFFALPLTFLNDTDSLKIWFNQYLLFTIASIFYILLLKIKNIVSEYKESNTFSFFNLGDSKQYIIILLVSIISIVLFLIIALFIPSSDSGLLTESGREHAYFMIFVAVPVEEFVFRGLLIDLVLIICNEFFFDILKVKRNERNSSNPKFYQINKWSWIIAIIISSISFALFHIDRYSQDFFIILYLFILGMFMGIARKISGMFSSYIIHLINNLLVLGFMALILLI